MDESQTIKERGTMAQRQAKRVNRRGEEVRPMRKLATMRAAAGLTQGDLAYMCGVRVNCISGYERGERSPNARMLSKLARACGCTVDDLDEYTDEPLNAL